ncbi:amidohydrolase [Sinorhizobium meliloti]|nr:amidohydrolase [Sinorhizobium meliloti]
MNEEMGYLWQLRQDLHRQPELLYDLPRTSARVVEELRRAGCDEVVTGVGRCGVVGLIRGLHGSGPTIGLRADMDALPITEATGLPYSSRVPGKMHACGHDGHTAGLIGAARRLATTRDFGGSAACIFQPAEEGGAGARTMLQDGLVDRFALDEIYGIHNLPGLPVGQFAVRPGPVMAAGVRFDITVTGCGGHAARPHETTDPLLAAAQIMTLAQTIVARSLDPLEHAVVSITSLAAGDAYNVIPAQAELRGTIRYLNDEVGALCQRRLSEIAMGTAELLNCHAEIVLTPGYPVTVNHPKESHAIRDLIIRRFGVGSFTDGPVQMASEDFAYMLQARPGAYILCGNGNSAACHHPAFDFADVALPYIVDFWTALVEDRASRLARQAR